ncbi:MAG TPA: EF-P beta-lysylation protein EpmB [Thiolinea sp.]|nr:EF-P beta-lysylation protein EpmB [Thiolinea sp.]
MTTMTTPPVSSWSRELAQAVRELPELLRLLELPPEQAAPAAARDFRVLVPHSYLARMQPGRADDPLLLQVLPQARELWESPGFLADPVGDRAAEVRPGVLHKYQGRVLLVTSGACAVHCRYCFRRHFPYSEASPVRDEWRTALDYIRSQNGVHEVILSGGDPLTLSERRLAPLLDGLAALPHVRTLRFHSRLPVVLPARIDAAFLALLQHFPGRKVMVIHANHARELLADDVQQALAALDQAGVTLLNQSVLLRGVNDQVAVLAELSEALFASRVMPYYLHLLDRVTGAAHFEVAESQALTLMAGLRQQLPGYLVPRLVREVAGELSKVPVPQ